MLELTNLNSNNTNSENLSVESQQDIKGGLLGSAIAPVAGSVIGGVIGAGLAGGATYLAATRAGVPDSVRVGLTGANTYAGGRAGAALSD
jgi:hypothetical protein